MSTKKEALLNLSDHELYAIFCSALLCAHNSFLGRAAAALSKALRYSLKLTITGSKGIAYQTVLEICTLLQIEYQEVEFTEIIKRNFVKWSNHSDDNSLRIYIPELNNQVSDLGILISFYLHYHIKKLRRYNPDFKMPKIDILYPILLWSEYLILNKGGLSSRLHQDLLNTENTSALLQVRESNNDIDEDMRHVHGRLFKLSESALLYIGFTQDYQLYEQFSDKKLNNYKSINRRSRRHINAMSLGSGSLSMPKFPYSIKRSVFEVDQLPVIFENLYVLNIYKIGEKPRDCLFERINEKSEEETCSKLKLNSFEDYQEWLIKSYISIEPSSNINVYEKWLQSCELIGLTPEIPDEKFSFIESTPDEQKENSTAISNEPRIRFSSDYRSVYVQNSGSYSLTEKQGEIIKILHDNYLNKTPEVSQNYIIQMVYGEIYETRLKKQFNNNDLWGLLIENGRKRGLIQLKM